MKICQNFISLCYPCSPKYHALQDFKFLKTKEQIIVGAVTALVTILTLPFFGLLTTLAFRCLVKKFSAKDLSKEKPVHDQLLNQVEKVQEERQKFFPMPEEQKEEPNPAPQSLEILVENDLKKEEVVQQENTIPKIELENPKKEIILEEPNIKQDPPQQEVHIQKKDHLLAEKLEILKARNASPLIFAIVENDMKMVKKLINKRDYFNTPANKGCLPLHWAVSEGHLEIVKLLIDDKVDIDAVDLTKRSPLHIAAETGKIEIVQFLLRKGAYPYFHDAIGNLPWDLANKNNHIAICELLDQNQKIKRILSDEQLQILKELDSPVINAIVEHDIDKLKELIKEGYDLEKNSPLIWATNEGVLEIVKLLIDNHVDINSRDEEREVALHAASDKGNFEIVEFLLKEGADPLIPDIDGSLPLHIAANQGHLQIVELLLDKTPIDTIDRNGLTPLAYAVLGKQVETIKFLLQKGASANIRDLTGKSPWLWAVHLGLLDIIKLLRPYYDINAYDNAQWTALMLAVFQGHTEVVEFLLGEKADACIHSKEEGIQSLHIAAMTGYVKIMKLILINGVDVDVLDFDGRTPLSYAAGAGEQEMIFFLLQNGADHNKPDHLGKTPLDYTKQNGHWELIDLLK